MDGRARTICRVRESFLWIKRTKRKKNNLYYSFFSHVKRVVNIVRKYRPTIRILIWDDVIRSDPFINNEKLVSSMDLRCFHRGYVLF